MTDPMSLDPTRTFPRADRHHDDKGRPDPAVVAAGAELDQALDRLLAAARDVARWCERGADPISYPISIIRSIRTLACRLHKFDRALASFRKV